MSTTFLDGMLVGSVLATAIMLGGLLLIGRRW